MIYTYSEDCNFPHSSADGQVTRCETCERSGSTFLCNMPTVSYGSTLGGIPEGSSYHEQYPIYEQWCKEIGFIGPASIQINSSYESVKNALYWCNTFDDDVWKWCDQQDGYWKNSTLDFKGNSPGKRILQLSCTIGKKIVKFRLP